MALTVSHRPYHKGPTLVFRLVDKAYAWAGGDAKRMRAIMRSRDKRFMAETEKLWRRLYPEIAPHFWKNGGSVIGVQMENESRGPWPYYQALKALAVKIGYDVPMYTRTGWPRLNGPETTFGEMIPLYGDYAEGFWDRELKSMPGGYKDAFVMRPARTSSVIATEQLGAQKAEDAKGAARYPYFTCELGGGMASSYHRRLVMEPMDAFAIAVVKLGSGSNLPGFYMYHGGSNPMDFGVNMAESQRGRFTNYNDLPVVSYEFQSPVSEFGEPQQAYWMIKALADFCCENAEELSVADPVFVNKHETRRGRFVFHNEYVRRINPGGACWIGVERDGKVERILDGQVLAACRPSIVGCRRLVVSDLKLLKPAGTPPPVVLGAAGVATMPEESAWDAAAEYEVPFAPGDNMLEISYEGDMARLYADGKLVQDDFWKGLPIRYALRRLPSGTKSLTLKVLPWGEGASERIFIDHSKAPANSKETTANRWLDAGAGRESVGAAEAPRLRSAAARDCKALTVFGDAASSRVMPDPLDRPRITRSKSDGLTFGIPSPAFHRTDFATHPARPRTDSPAFYRTNFARAPARQSDGLTFGIPSPAFPRTDSRPPLGNLIDNSTIIQPLLNSAPTVGNFNPSTTVLQPPHQPSFNRLPTTTHTLLAQASSHPPRQGRKFSSSTAAQTIHPTLAHSSSALLTLLPHSSSNRCHHSSVSIRETYTFGRAN